MALARRVVSCGLIFAEISPGGGVLTDRASRVSRALHGAEADAHCSIQTAIDIVFEGDAVVVAEGTYFEAIDILGRTITVRSPGPDDPDVAAATIIDGDGNVGVADPIDLLFAWGACP